MILGLGIGARQTPRDQSAKICAVASAPSPGSALLFQYTVCALGYGLVHSCWLPCTILPDSSRFGVVFAVSNCFVNGGICSHYPSFPLNLQLATPSSKSSGNPPAATPRSTTSVGHISVSENSVEAKKDLTAAATAGSPTTSLTIYSKKSESNTNVFGTTTTTITGSRSPADKNSNSRSSNACDGENHASYKNLIYRNNVRSSINNRDNVNTGSSTALGFGFPPENVLRGRARETITYRCEETRGGCSVSDAPPHPSSGGRLIPSPGAILKKAAVHHINTNLSISIVEASPVTNEGKRSNSSSSSSSDATTITDENGSVSHLLTLSP
ncbi:hypothetical protein Acr_00g0065670 [Actinidia rufa]|uniref:Uncharacterized protein n=1 Tax=Actinidia rufa TaxID=165716 RepID=A0A7J0DQ45_9ERIC|nr:hypothetical protein Acr_00g0065670 [Actinidia rufa]